MATEPWVPPPPISSLELTYARFSWCQVQYVFASELVREQPEISWYQAYVEAGQVVESLKLTRAPLALGAGPGEVVWPVMICAANRYARFDAAHRQSERIAFAAGRPIWSINVDVNNPMLCDPAVLDEPQYSPEPPCAPRAPVTGLFALAGIASGMVGTYLCLSVLMPAISSGAAHESQE